MNIILRIFKQNKIVNTKNLLILTGIVVVLGLLFGWFDNFQNLASFGVFLAWFALYQVIQNMEVNNKNSDKIERRFEELEKEIWKR